VLDDTIISYEPENGDNRFTEILVPSIKIHVVTYQKTVIFGISKCSNVSS
jgi:hypothetical protein